MERKTILIVDDSEDIRDALSEYLSKAGFMVYTAADGEEMKTQMELYEFHLIILDIMLPGDDGLTLCANIRRHSYVPIIMLTAVTDEFDRIAGLEVGADDYITKTFSPRELLARIKALLRRTQFSTISRHVCRLHFLSWTFDRTRRLLMHDAGHKVQLSGSDYSLLTLFLQKPNYLFSRDEIAMAIWGREMDPFERGVDMQMSRLRKHLNDEEKNIIISVRNKGYMFAVDKIVEC